MENYSSGGGLITNNTVYQVSGDAVRLDSSAFNVKLRNNIVWVQAGHDVYVADNSRTGFNSDYNDLYISNGGSAFVGFWNSAVNNGVQSQLSNWQSATGQDAHSLSANPDFVNVNGNDGLLGYTQVNGTYADHGQDDNFYLSGGSPAIARGDSWNAPVTDILGFPRQADPGTPNQGSPDYFPAAASHAGLPQRRHGAELARDQHLLQLHAPLLVQLLRPAVHDGLAFQPTAICNFKLPARTIPPTAAIPPRSCSSDARIAPLWASLETNQTGDDIYVTTSVSNQVTFRWVATNTADGSPANFAVTLYSNGGIQFYYGAGNTNLSPTVGISAGNGLDYQLLSGYSGQTTLTNAPSVVYSLQPGIVDLGAYGFRGSSLDTTPPTVTGTSPAAIAASGTTFSFTQFQVSFSKPVNPIDADSPAAYELREAGSNGFGSSQRRDLQL